MGDEGYLCGCNFSGVAFNLASIRLYLSCAQRLSIFLLGESPKQAFVSKVDLAFNILSSMKFINGKLIDVGYNHDIPLLLSYEGKLRPKVKAIPDVEINDLGVFCLNITFKITVSTVAFNSINKYIGEYNFEIENDGLPLKEDKQFILTHVKTGLLYALGRFSGNNTNFVNEVWSLINLTQTIEKILSCLVRLGYYSY